MSFVSRFYRWIRRLKQPHIRNLSGGPLREFVYLDEVSVYSILASRKGGIATEFTESQTASLNSETGSSLGIGFGVANANFVSKSQTGRTQGSQVLRKAIIQTSFRELYDIESASLALTPPYADCIPTIHKIADLEEKFEQLVKDGCLVDPSTVRRGELLEVEVTLEADPIFRAASVIATLRELMEDNEHLFGQEITAQLPQMRSMAQILEGLLVGLVPIRGCLVDYQLTKIGGHEVLIHSSLLDQIAPVTGLKTYPVYVVGVAQRNLFWKDIRQVLFSDAQHTVFCRLAKAGLAERWHPVKVANVLAGIVPQFDELIGDFSEKVRLAMTAPADFSQSKVVQDTHSGMQVISEYATLLVGHHRGTIMTEMIDDLVQRISPGQDWLSSVDCRRSVFAEVTKHIDKTLGVNTSGEDAYELRNDALRRAGLAVALAPPPASNGNKANDAADTRRQEKFLEAEFVAIYW